MAATDAQGNLLSTSLEAAGLWRDFSLRLQRQRSGMPDALQRVLDADPEFGVAHAIAGVVSACLKVPNFDPGTEIEAAQTGAAEHAWERSFIEAAAAAVAQGPLWASVEGWFAHHTGHPTDINGLIFGRLGAAWSADANRFVELGKRVAQTHAAVGDDPTILGFRGMGSQERGDLDAAERFASLALELDPTGSVGAHPMAHVFFERGDHAGGAAWLDEWLPTADPAGGFTAHLHWHHALHHLAMGDTERVLSTYVDRLCEPSPTALPDRSSMLWRLQLHGVVDENADPSTEDFSDMLSSSVDFIPFTFVGVHVALGLATRGDVVALRRFAATAARSAAPGASTLVQPIALALADRIDGAASSAADRLIAIEHQFPVLGGSHAQREVFEDTLIDTLIRAGRTEDAERRLKVRLDRRPGALDQGWLIASG